MEWNSASLLKILKVLPPATISDFFAQIRLLEFDGTAIDVDDFVNF